MRSQFLVTVLSLGAVVLAGCASTQISTKEESRGPSSVAPHRGGYNGECPNLVGTWNCEGNYQIVFRGSSDPTYLNYSGDDWKVSGKKEVVQKDGQPLTQQITCADGVLYRKYWVDAGSPAPEQFAIRNDDNVMNAMGTTCRRASSH